MIMSGLFFGASGSCTSRINGLHRYLPNKHSHHRRATSQRNHGPSLTHPLTIASPPPLLPPPLLTTNSLPAVLLSFATSVTWLSYGIVLISVGAGTMYTPTYSLARGLFIDEGYSATASGVIFGGKAVGNGFAR